MLRARAVHIIVCVILITGLLVGCSASKTLKVEIDDISQTCRLVDSSTKTEIAYTKLIFQGQDVVKTSYVSMGLHLAFDEDQVKMDGSATSYNGGKVITKGSSWKYKLNDGVLEILE